jgi:hypothetical protein
MNKPTLSLPSRDEAPEVKITAAEPVKEAPAKYVKVELLKNCNFLKGFVVYDREDPEDEFSKLIAREPDAMELRKVWAGAVVGLKDPVEAKFFLKANAVKMANEIAD